MAARRRFACVACDRICGERCSGSNGNYAGGYDQNKGYGESANTWGECRSDAVREDAPQGGRGGSTVQGLRALGDEAGAHDAYPNASHRADSEADGPGVPIMNLSVYETTTVSSYTFAAVPIMIVKGGEPCYLYPTTAPPS